MIRIDLPGVLALTCPKCREVFKMRARALSGRTVVACPLCAMELSVYDALPSLLRRQIYHAIRDSVEQRVYEQQQMDRSDYCEDWGNLPIDGRHTSE